MRGIMAVLAIVTGLGVMAFGPGRSAALADESEVPLRTADEQAVYDAVLDYVDAIYLVEPARIERSVHRDLRKHGYMRRGESWGDTPMSWQQLHDLAGSYNTGGRIGADAPKEITVFDVLDKTASAKLVADWGVDYFHLVEEDGRWQIINVLWQTPPQM